MFSKNVNVNIEALFRAPPWCTLPGHFPRWRRNSHRLVRDIHNQLIVLLMLGYEVLTFQEFDHYIIL